MVEDIYEGEILTVWKDEGFVYISLPWVTINVPHGEMFNELLHDLDGFVHSLIDKVDSGNWEEQWNKKMGDGE